MIKKVQFHFYKIDAELEKDLLDNSNMSDIEKIYEALKNTKKPKNVYKLNGYPAFVKHVRGNIFCFEKHRVTDLPTIGKTTEDKEREIKLEDDETIIEKNYFLLNTDLSYIIYQTKFEGFRAPTLSGYLQKLLNAKNRIRVQQILQKDTYQKLLKFGYIKGMDITFANPSHKVLKEWGISLDRRLKIFGNRHKSISLNIVLEEKSAGILSFIKSVPDRLRKTSDNIRNLKIKGSEDIDSNLETLNLLNDILEETVSVKISDRHIAENDIIDALLHTDAIYSDEIRELFDDDGSHTSHT